MDEGRYSLYRWTEPSINKYTDDHGFGSFDKDMEANKFDIAKYGEYVGSSDRFTDIIYMISKYCGGIKHIGFRVKVWHNTKKIWTIEPDEDDESFDDF